MGGGVSVNNSLALETTFTVLATLAIGLRFRALKLTRRKINSSDYLIVIGLIFVYSVLTVGWLMVYIGGAGHHMSQLSDQQITRMLQLFIAAAPLWPASTCSVKLSILSFYLATFRGDKMRWSIYITSFATFVLFVITTVEPFCQCRPFKYTWDKFSSTGTCLNMTPFLVTIASFNMVIDLTIFCLPLPILWGLNMEFQKKFHLSVVFLLGLVVCIMSALRLQALFKIVETDFTWTILDEGLWAVLEITLGIINACLPFMMPLVKKMHLPSITISSRMGSRKSRLFSNSNPNMRGESENSDFALHLESPRLYQAHVETGSQDSISTDYFGNRNIKVNHSVQISISDTQEYQESNYV